MRTMQRNQQTIYYRLFNTTAPVEGTYDEYGNPLESGEYGASYSDPVEMMCNVSPATGSTNRNQFGNLENYDKVIVTTWTECPIDEASVLYIDSVPTKTGNVWSSHDYVVSRVSKSINGISIAVRKVDVS